MLFIIPRVNFVRRLIIVSLHYGCWPKRDIIKLDPARFSVMKPNHLHHRVTCICRRARSSWAPRDSLKDRAIIRVITDMNIHRGRGEKGLKESDYQRWDQVQCTLVLNKRKSKHAYIPTGHNRFTNTRDTFLRLKFYTYFKFKCDSNFSLEYIIRISIKI